MFGLGWAFFFVSLILWSDSVVSRRESLSQRTIQSIYKPLSDVIMGLPAFSFQTRSPLIKISKTGCFFQICIIMWRRQVKALYLMLQPWSGRVSRSLEFSNEASSVVRSLVFLCSLILFTYVKITFSSYAVDLYLVKVV